MTTTKTRSTSCYAILGVEVTVTADVPEVLARVDETYAAFRQSSGVSTDTERFDLRCEDDGALCVTGPDGVERRWPTEHEALLDLLDRLVATVLAGLHGQGLDAVHAGAVVHRGRAAILAGVSRHGKTTLTLGLVARGMGLLSDEFAVVDSANRLVLPYRRSAHVRPGTPELIPALSFVRDLPRHHLGGGSEWSLPPSALARALPGGLGVAAPLGHVLLIEGSPAPQAPPTLTPVPTALAAMELLRGTWSASVDFGGALRRIGRALDGVACARLRAGALEPTLDQVTAWLEADRG